MNEKRILIVDDDPNILELLNYNLEKEGYKVKQAENGIIALNKVQKFKPDLILLDVMMPELDGIETCIRIREMKEGKECIIAFLSARNEDYSQISGLDAGADDYITKPIKPRVLLSKVAALLRRNAENKSDRSEIEIEGIRIDHESYLVFKNGESLNLPRKEFELLSLLFSKPGKVFTREVILDKIWGSDVVVSDRTIDVHIRKLREKVGQDVIKTVKGVGYKINSN